VAPAWPLALPFALGVRRGARYGECAVSVALDRRGVAGQVGEEEAVAVDGVGLAGPSASCSA
jgi:hypothetical protein